MVICMVDAECFETFLNGTGIFTKVLDLVSSKGVANAPKYMSVYWPVIHHTKLRNPHGPSLNW
jgi:hypothetical protein